MWRMWNILIHIRDKKVNCQPEIDHPLGGINDGKRATLMDLSFPFRI